MVGRVIYWPDFAFSGKDRVRILDRPAPDSRGTF